MTQHISAILAHWYPKRDAYSWVLGTVIEIEGSNYRKIGAMILVNELGQTFGLISGGCLEKSLLLEVKKVLLFERPLRVCFDSSDNSDSVWARALGCGGKVTILLQPINATTHYHHLDQVYSALASRSAAYYAVALEDNLELNRLIPAADFTACANSPSQGSHYFNDQRGHNFLALALRPPTHLVIFGGGIDAIAMVQIALVLGWHITLIDNRAGYAKAADFPAAITIIRKAADDPSLTAVFQQLDAAIVMTHNIAMDALALSRLHNSSARYIGLLGPEHRKHKVLARAGVGPLAALCGPMGFAIGGDLPASIALATLAQCHQVLEASQSARQRWVQPGCARQERIHSTN